MSDYLARPDGDGPWPGVVAIHEVFGIDEVFRRNCDRLAAAGYLVLGVDLYHDNKSLKCVAATMRTMIRGEGKALDDIEAARQELLASPDCTGKVGVIGFCMGGAFALLTATTGFEVAADNYGKAPKQSALAGACPVVASYGGRDPLMLGQAGRVEKALVANGVEHDLKVYPGVGHSFLNEEENAPRLFRPFARVLNIGPRPEAATDAWERIEAFFVRYLR